MASNWRFDNAEIDIIACKNHVVVFVEVKTRKSDRYGFPEEAVDDKKQENLSRAAEGYLEENNIESEVRFDIISVLLNTEPPEICHIEDAFFPESEE